MGYSVEDSHVKALLFNQRGKWKYTVCLDYTGQTTEEWEDWDLWKEARKALKRATENGISGVTMDDVPEGWSLVIPEPRGKTAHPIMVRGGFVGLADTLFGSRGGVQD